jgi:hypothetical protein
MSEDAFANAGKSFRNKLARDFTAQEHAMARLREIRTTCQAGIATFYKAANLGLPNVEVGMPTEQQVSIQYGYRPGRGDGSFLTGPFAVVFVTPDGRTLLATDLRWKATDAPPLKATAIRLANDNWQDEISEWLVNFLVESERLYTKAIY